MHTVYREDANPMKVGVFRNFKLESRHEISVSIFSPRGEEGYGSVSEPVFPRSCVKFLQAWPLLDLGFRHLTRVPLACASHHGESFHIRELKAWADDLNISESDLVCGAHPPFNDEAALNLKREGLKPTRFHNNCSGKHLGFAQWCRLKGCDFADYQRPSHPMQQAIITRIENATGMKATEWGTDGCGIPTLFLPLRSWGQALFEMLRSLDLETWKTIGDHPLLLSGTENWQAQMMAQHQSQVIVKSGAEGMCAVLIPHLQKVAIMKCHDGSSRPLQIVVKEWLRSNGINSNIDCRIYNWARDPVGEIRIVDENQFL